jgi:hypothetical protein
MSHRANRGHVRATNGADIGDIEREKRPGPPGGHHELDCGFARPTDYATERLGLTARRVQTLVALARRLAPLPRVAAVYERGALSQSQAALLSRLSGPRIST